MGKRGHGEGTIYQRKDGTWAGQVTIDYDSATRKTKRATFYGRTRKEVLDKIDQARQDQRSGAFIEPHRTTVGKWLDRWLSAYQKPAVSKKTYALQEMVIRLHIKPTLGHVLLAKLKPGDLQQLYTDKLEKGRADGNGGLSSQTVRHMHNILSKSFKQAMKEGLVNRNVAQATSPPKVIRLEEMRWLSREEVGRLLAALEGERLSAAFLLDLSTGLRRGELLALKWSDVDLERGILQVRKSLDRVKQDDGTTKLEFNDPKTPKSRRLIPLPDEVVRELWVHRARQAQEKLKLGGAYQDQGMVFATALGTPICPRNFLRHWTRLLAKAGIPHTRFHNLRHTFATMLLEAGEHPKVVQEILGHTSIVQTIDTYSHVVPGLKKQAAATVNSIIRKARANIASR